MAEKRKMDLPLLRTMNVCGEKRGGGLILLHPPKHHRPRAAFRGDISLHVWSSKGSEMLSALEEKQPEHFGVVDHPDGLR